MSDSMKMLFILLCALPLGQVNCIPMPLNNLTSEIGEMMYGDSETKQNILFDMIRSFMDPSTDPCTDFFQYACGNFDKYNYIATGQALNSVFEIATFTMRQEINGIIKRIPEIVAKSSNERRRKTNQKLYDYYSSCMDVDEIRANGSEQLLELIRSFETGTAFDGEWKKEGVSVEELLGKLRRFGFKEFISTEVAPDFTDLDTNILFIREPSPKFADGDYGSSQKMAIMGKVGKIIRKIVKNTRNIRIVQIKNAVAALEHNYYKILTPLSQQKHSTESFQKLSLHQLEYEIPGFNWKKYLSALYNKPIDYSQQVIVINKPYFARLGELFKSTDVVDLVNYIMVEFATEMDNLIGLPESLAEATLRWYRCVEFAAKHMDEPLAKLYAIHAIKLKRKSAAIRLAENIKNRMRHFIRNEYWIGPDNKAQVEEKLENMDVTSIGIPEYFFNQTIYHKYETVVIRKNGFFFNTLELLKLAVDREIHDIGKAVDMNRLGFSSMTLAANQELNKNKLSIGLGFLLPPFFDREFPWFFKYGVLGFIIGHEIFHGFDNIGNKFADEEKLDGNLYIDETAKRFQNISQCIAQEYDGLGVVGNKTLKENLADSVGLTLAYSGYEEFLINSRYREFVPNLELSSKQLFFLSFAQYRCTTYKDGNLGYMESDAHPPEVTRVIGTLRQSREFAKAYSCPVGSRMNPEKKCNLS